MKSTLFIFLFAAIAFALTSFSEETPKNENPQWHKTKREDDLAITYIHESSMDSQSLSYLSVYPVDSETDSVKQLMDELKSDEKNKDKDLEPANCYVLKRSDLETHQTWCEKSKSEVVVIVEEGKEKMRENQKVAIVLEQVFGSSK